MVSLFVPLSWIERLLDPFIVVLLFLCTWAQVHIELKVRWRNKILLYCDLFRARQTLANWSNYHRFQRTYAGWLTLLQCIQFWTNHCSRSINHLFALDFVYFGEDSDSFSVVCGVAIVLGDGCEGTCTLIACIEILVLFYFRLHFYNY